MSPQLAKTAKKVTPNRISQSPVIEAKNLKNLRNHRNPRNPKNNRNLWKQQKSQFLLRNQKSQSIHWRKQSYLVTGSLVMTKKLSYQMRAKTGTAFSLLLMVTQISIKLLPTNGLRCNLPNSKAHQAIYLHWSKRRLVKPPKMIRVTTHATKSLLGSHQPIHSCHNAGKFWINRQLWKMHPTCRVLRTLSKKQKTKPASAARRKLRL